jgi:16S rRNA (cytosine1402-N4)-methyltransferase
VIGYHKAVLVNEVLTYLAPRPNGLYVDATFGGGSHTRAILEAEPTCKVIGVDWDQQALDLNAPEVEAAFPGRFTPLWGNFAQLPFLFKREGIERVDGILADFGTSQYQITAQPGFSFAHDTRLDMRMSPAHQQHTAYDLVNWATEQELAHIFYVYGEEHQSRKIARAIVEARKRSPIKTTVQLAQLIEGVIPRRGAKIHPATKMFQALRIAVNKELDNINAFLIHSLELLNLEGRLVCISFHSLEDRMVKQFLREHKTEFEILTPKIVTATEEERLKNASSRSARLRAAKLISRK